MHNGRVAISATGSRETLASTQEVDWLLLWAPASNEQVIKIGSITVTNTDDTTDGLPIIPGAPPILLKSCDVFDVNIIGFATDVIYYVGSSGYTLGTGS